MGRRVSPEDYILKCEKPCNQKNPTIEQDKISSINSIIKAGTYIVSVTATETQQVNETKPSATIIKHGEYETK
ncbi:MAG: hypothetical protein PWQ10_220 [Patescibacteria group bacterium]|nr:hypothetical protein [Patescibacteria group bacterium]